MKAMILAAGIGSRLKELTTNTPKALIKIKDKTLLEIVISNLNSQGISDVIINLNHFAQQIIEFVESNNNFGINIEFSHEKELLDTGGGLKNASWFFNDGASFILHNVDVLSDLNIIEMLKFHNTNESKISIAVRTRKTSRYFLFNEENILCGWRNEATGEEKVVRESSQNLNPFSFMGIHIISPQVFKYFPEEDNFSIVDFYLDLAAENKILGFKADKYSWIDCGKPENLLNAKEFI